MEYKYVGGKYVHFMTANNGAEPGFGIEKLSMVCVPLPEHQWWFNCESGSLAGQRDLALKCRPSMHPLCMDWFE
jgi:hypothetical protein